MDLSGFRLLCFAPKECTVYTMLMPLSRETGCCFCILQENKNVYEVDSLSGLQCMCLN
jgi:hypothetical protein